MPGSGEMGLEMSGRSLITCCLTTRSVDGRYCNERPVMPVQDWQLQEHISKGWGIDNEVGNTPWFPVTCHDTVRRPLLFHRVQGCVRLCLPGW